MRSHRSKWLRGRFGKRKPPALQNYLKEARTSTGPAPETLPSPPAMDGPEAHGARVRLWMLLASVAALSAALWRPLLDLIEYCAEESLHSHILLVPFVSAYFIYLQKSALPKSVRSSPVLGSITFAIGVAAFGFAKHAQPQLSPGDYLSCIAFSFVTLVIAGAFFFLGRGWMSVVTFPIAFLYFFVPLPNAAIHGLETLLKLGSAEAAAVFFGIVGTPVLRDGVIFQLPNITLEVAQECSGIRSSWVLFIVSLVASYLLLKSPWRRAVLLGVVIPLAILRNGFRILVIGLLCVHIGPHMIHSIIHESGGPLFFALSLVPLFLLLWWLRKGEGKTSSEKQPL